MINEIAPNIFNISLLRRGNIKSEEQVLCYKNGKVLMKTIEDKFIIPQKNELGEWVSEGILLGEIDGEKCFIAEGKEEVPQGFDYVGMRDIRRHPDKLSKWITAVGFHLYNWINDNKFCGRCGNSMELKNDERALKCTSCKNIIFPKLSPAIIVAITKGDKLLLAKNKLHPGSFYSLIAGYVEAGETIEETVKREVMEEVGIDVKNISYYKSQPWPFSSSLMLGFFAEYDGNKPIKVDGIELSHADWFDANNLPEIPNRDSVAGEMIRIFRDKNKRQSL
ncbi:NAD(+) diphosphatase [uncultured Ilyobacter sp.]|uniref:NAD(+) diphosphatase n=1 Tax=uncultured Ilyobacter sp. TaxID=544433 RepID=UPI0029C0C417|nr:NAD(+) diphosphatase [uncultured Ilyobacter sp.]